jgi:hypothetical protein
MEAGGAALEDWGARVPPPHLTAIARIPEDGPETGPETSESSHEASNREAREREAGRQSPAHVVAGVGGNEVRGERAPRAQGVRHQADAPAVAEHGGRDGEGPAFHRTHGAQGDRGRSSDQVHAHVLHVLVLDGEEGPPWGGTILSPVGPQLGGRSTRPPGKRRKRQRSGTSQADHAIMAHNVDLPSSAPDAEIDSWHLDRRRTPPRPASHRRVRTGIRHPTLARSLPGPSLWERNLRQRLLAAPSGDFESPRRPERGVAEREQMFLLVQPFPSSRRVRIAG